MKKVEIFLVSLLFIAFLLEFGWLVPGSALLMGIVALLLAQFYLFLGLALFNGIGLRQLFKKDSYAGLSKLRILGSIAAGVGLFTTVIGIAFRVQLLPGGIFIITLALLCLLPVLITAIVRHSPDKKSFYQPLILRLGAAVVLCLLGAFTPTSSISDFKYRHHPERAPSDIEDIRQIDDSPVPANEAGRDSL